MSIDCQWIEKNMEALFCDTLAEQESRTARTHIEGCEKCRDEVNALIAIDPVVKRYFQQQLAVAQAHRPRRTRMSFVYGTAAAAIAAGLLMVVTLRTPEVNVGNPPVPDVSQNIPAVAVESAPPVRSEAVPEIERTKPRTEAPALDSMRTVAAPATDSSAPDFVVVDAVGYSRTLDDYRGFVVVIAVWNADQTDAAANLEGLYKEFASETRLRFIGVANERQNRADGTTFPIFYNQRSRLLDAKPGDFVLIDERGTIALRGSLITDSEKLSRQLRELR